MTDRALPVWIANRVQHRGRVAGGARVGITTPTGYANETDLFAYRDMIDGVIVSLDSDIKAQFVTVDPTEHNFLTDIMDAADSTWRDKLTARATAKGPAQTAKEIDYFSRWSAFYDNWQKRKAAVTPSAFGVPLIVLSQWWDSLRDDHQKLLDLYNEFKSLGGAPSEASNPGEVPDKIIKAPTWTLPAAVTLKALSSLLPWWAWAGLAVVGVGAAIVYGGPVVSAILPRKVAA